MKTCRFCLAVMLLVLALVLPAWADSFEGEWFGHWENSLGERGRDSLSLRQTRDGTYKGIWSGDTKVWGERTGEHTMRLHGRRDDGVSYNIEIHKERGEMELRYFATRPNGSRYDGFSRLRRSY